MLKNRKMTPKYGSGHFRVTLGFYQGSLALYDFFVNPNLPKIKFQRGSYLCQNTQDPIQMDPGIQILSKKYLQGVKITMQISRS